MASLNLRGARFPERDTVELLGTEAPLAGQTRRMTKKEKEKVIKVKTKARRLEKAPLRQEVKANMAATGILPAGQYGAGCSGRVPGRVMASIRRAVMKGVFGGITGHRGCVELGSWASY